MAKLKADPIGEKDLIEYLKTISDFAFELKVLRTLLEKGFRCEHGGSYEDPTSKKTRQFDIRAVKQIADHWVYLAVECKNLRTNFPLLVSCVPRRSQESYHELICTRAKPAGYSLESTIAPLEVRNIRLKYPLSIYALNAPVGKSCAQVGRHSDGSLITNDQDVYERWAQALSSAQDLADHMSTLTPADSPVVLSAVFPVLVVPDGLLWTSEFDSTGKIKESPKPADRCSFFVDKYYFVGNPIQGAPYKISHLEFVTVGGLIGMIEDFFTESEIDRVFLMREVLSQLTNE